MWLAATLILRKKTNTTIFFSLKDLQNFVTESLPHYRSCPFSVSLNEIIIGIETLDGICSPTLVVNQFSGLFFFLHSSIFAIKHSTSA